MALLYFALFRTFLNLLNYTCSQYTEINFHYPTIFLQQVLVLNSRYSGASLKKSEIMRSKEAPLFKYVRTYSEYTDAI